MHVRARIGKRQFASDNCEIVPGRIDVNAVRFNFHTVRGEHGFQRGALAEQFRQKTRVPRTLMRDDDECHSRLGRQMTEELFKGFEASGRSTDTHYGEQSLFRCSRAWGWSVSKRDRVILLVDTFFDCLGDICPVVAHTAHNVDLLNLPVSLQLSIIFSRPSLFRGSSESSRNVLLPHLRFVTRKT